MSKPEISVDNSLLIMEKLRSWKEEGRFMSDYDSGHCYPFLFRLAGLDFVSSWNGEKQIDAVSRKLPGLQTALLGSHGYTILRVHMIRYEQRLKEGQHEPATT